MSQSQMLNILLVDDDEEDYIITKDLIRQVNNQQCKLSWAESMDEALRIHDQFDIFLVDYKIGIENGIDFIKSLHNLRPETPVILLTGMANNEVDVEAMKAGAYDYLVKGKIDAERLERSIRYAMEHARHLKQIRLLNEQLQQRVEEQSLALTRSQEILLAIARNYPSGVICTYNTELRCEFIEGKALSIHNLSAADFIGKTVYETFAGELANIHHLHFSKTLNGENTTYEILFENESYLINTTPIARHDGVIERILVVVTNISTIKMAEENMKLALQKANELNELKSRFVSTASHEFRTPLSTILSSTNLIEKYYHLRNDNQFIKHTHKVKSAINNLTQILEDFLSVEKLEEGIIKIVPSEFQLTDFIQSIIEDMRDTLKPEQSLQFICNGKNTSTLQDKKFLRAITQNLLSNAIKYSDSGTNILVKLNINDKDFDLIVADNGIGIPRSEQQHMFDRFYRAKNASGIEGTGIGLNLVKKYVELMRGSIRFESELNKGTTFYVKLPLTLSI